MAAKCHNNKMTALLSENENKTSKVQNTKDAKSFCVSQEIPSELFSDLSETARQ